MENVKSVLEAFLKKELERDELVLQIEQRLKQTPTFDAEIRSYLMDLHQTKRLSTEDYSALKSLIEPFEKTQLAKRQSMSDGHQSSLPSQSKERVLKQGLVIHDHYRLVKEIGKGGMGVVWKAIDLIQKQGDARDCHVALKFLTQDFKQHPDALKALVREFQRYQRVTHPNIIKTHDLYSFGSNYFLAMEFLEGIPLNKFIKSYYKNGLSLKKAEPIIKDMAHALAYAHQEGIAHLDFKPANVFYNPNTNCAKVIDFGIARPLTRAERTETQFDPGSLGALTHTYASYEMLLGLEPDPRDDIYGLACVTYELLSGNHPFNNKKAIDVEYENLSPKPIKGLKHQQNKALLHGLALERDERTATVDEFLAELFPEKSPLIGVGIIVLIVVIVTGFFAWGYFKPQQPIDKALTQEPVKTAAQEEQRLQEAARAARLAAEQEEARAARLAAEQEEARLAAEQEARLAEQKRQQAQVADLLKECQTHLDAQRLTTGRRGTALACYQEVLKQAPGNVKALEGLQQIERRYQAWAEKAFRNNELKKIPNYLKGLERVNPQSTILYDLRERLKIER